MQYRGRLKAGPIDLDIFRGLLQNNEAISAGPRLKVCSNKMERSHLKDWSNAKTQLQNYNLCREPSGTRN